MDDKEPPSRTFAFHVTLTVSEDVAIEPLALRSLLLDGIFALDDENRLFPGVTHPRAEERLVAASAAVDDKATTLALLAVEQGYERLMRVRPRVGWDVRSRTFNDLVDCAAEVQGNMRDHGKLLALLRSLAEHFGRSEEAPEEIRQRAQAVLLVAQRLSEVFVQEVQPVL